jgi:hypothetical protein
MSKGGRMLSQAKSISLWKAIALLALVSIGGYGQKKETIQAQAFGTTTLAGRSFGVTIGIESYSTAADQKALIEAFQRGGHDELVKVLRKMKSRGHVGITGDVGYQIAYVRNIPTSTGRTVRIITDRPINVGEARNHGRSLDYDLCLLEVHLKDKDKDNSTGNLVVGGRFKVDKKTKQLEFETYHATPWRLAGIIERR